MKNNPYAGLKKETPENDQRCFELLDAARMIHKDAVIFDATLQDDGQVKLSFYTYEWETRLQKHAEAFVKQPNARDLVVGFGGGTLVHILTEEELPMWVKQRGVSISEVLGYDGRDGEEFFTHRSINPS